RAAYGGGDPRPSLRRLEARGAAGADRSPLTAAARGRNVEQRGPSMAFTPVVIVVSALLAAAPTEAPAEFEVIALQHRTVAEVLPQLLPLVGADAAIAGNGDQLFVRGSPEMVAAVRSRVA